MSVQIERSSEERFSRFSLVRAVRRRLAQADRAPPTGGTLSDKASGVEAFTIALQERCGQWCREGRAACVLNGRHQKSYECWRKCALERACVVAHFSATESISETGRP